MPRRSHAGGIGSNQYVTMGMSTMPSSSRAAGAEVIAVLESPDIEEVAAAFDPNGDMAWEWAFPAPQEREQWRRVCKGGAMYAREWRDLGFDWTNARRWINKGFGPEGALLWSPVAKPGDAAGWQRRGFSIDMASVWIAQGIGPADAHRWRAAVVSPWKAARLAESGVRAAPLSGFRKVGLSEDEAVALIHAGCGSHKTLERWQALGFTVKDTLDWAPLQIGAVHSAEWRDQYGIDTARVWRRRFPNEKTLRPDLLDTLAKAGITDANIGGWLNMIGQTGMTVRQLEVAASRLGFGRTALLSDRGVDLASVVEKQLMVKLSRICAALEGTLTPPGLDPAIHPNLAFTRRPDGETLSAMFGTRYASATLAAFRLHGDTAWLFLPAGSDPDTAVVSLATGVRSVSAMMLPDVWPREIATPARLPGSVKPDRSVLLTDRTGRLTVQRADSPTGEMIS